jgi:hypothetical protein
VASSVSAAGQVATRYGTIFQIGYSIRLEKMQAMFLARIDRFVNFMLMLLGAAVITTVFPVAIGSAIAALGGFSFVLDGDNQQVRP